MRRVEKEVEREVEPWGPLEYRKAKERFRGISTLYASGRCRVFRVRSTYSGEVLALKVIEGGGRGGGEARIFRAVDRLVHWEDGQFSYRDSWEEDGAEFIVMRLFIGPIDRLYGRLSLTEKLEILLQLANQVRAMHAGGFAHLDLKPTNVFFDFKGSQLEVHLLDFGLARGPGEFSPLSGGDPLTLAPELNRSEDFEHLDLEKCDVFSLAATFVDLFSGLLNRWTSFSCLRRVSSSFRATKPPKLFSFASRNHPPTPRTPSPP